MNVTDRVRESNRIEGIDRAPTAEEVAEHERFVLLDVVTIAELVRFVGVYEPEARFRDKSGLDVVVGRHVPPRGGREVREALIELLADANAADRDTREAAWRLHVRYETLHPFTDGNGRSGRILWYWLMAGDPQAALGFLHAFYYQTLDSVGRSK